VRVREQRNEAQTGTRQPYQVVRWRHAYQDNVHNTADQSFHRTVSSLDPGIYTASGRSEGNSPVNAQNHDAVPGSPLVRAKERSSHDPSPLQDRLLNLIHFNVLRAVFSNKLTIMPLVEYFEVGNRPDEPNIRYLEGAYPARAVVSPKANNIPVSLFPTQLQTTVEHPTWIDSIPFPSMRDNLIKWEGHYDHMELSQDMVGNLLDITAFYKSRNVEKRHTAGRLAPLPGADEELATIQDGLIVWGEPHDPNSWEMTPGFLRKWWWALEGCQDLMVSSNRWRRHRGEKPLSAVP
jgi:hypothetical protein